MEIKKINTSDNLNFKMSDAEELESPIEQPVKAESQAIGNSGIQEDKEVLKKPKKEKEVKTCQNSACGWEFNIKENIDKCRFCGETLK
jgi:hypothetical protein